MGLHYRKLTVWRKSMDLSKGTYKLVPLLPKEEVYGIRSQLTRAVTSISANIAEGWTRGSEAQRAHFLSIAQGSLAETETFLTLCEELNWFPEPNTVEARDLIAEVRKMLTSLRRKLAESCILNPAS